MITNLRQELDIYVVLVSTWISIQSNGRLSTIIFKVPRHISNRTIKYTLMIQIYVHTTKTGNSSEGRMYHVDSKNIF